MRLPTPGPPLYRFLDPASKPQTKTYTSSPALLPGHLADRSGLLRSEMTLSRGVSFCITQEPSIAEMCQLWSEPLTDTAGTGPVTLRLALKLAGQPQFSNTFFVDHFCTYGFSPFL